MPILSNSKGCSRKKHAPSLAWAWQCQSRPSMSGLRHCADSAASEQVHCSCCWNSSYHLISNSLNFQQEMAQQQTELQSANHRLRCSISGNTLFASLLPHFYCVFVGCSLNANTVGWCPPSYCQEFFLSLTAHSPFCINKWTWTTSHHFLKCAWSWVLRDLFICCELVHWCAWLISSTFAVAVWALNDSCWNLMTI